ncbi:MurR/RpiR family transcriptional regulator [Aquamicrobium sp. LC103]|uniref:MurR/RpiR family transcriptional regulator n=1 Tax=Aquamicrobium sp. LC103 TaxID=1120658 RepID=UPI00063E8D41|nr:MurR/RpiR family transcriptional regulator [Aquamicrobium sp. LC103]
MSIQETWARIESRYADFSPQLQRAARFVREHPQEVALNSLRAVSREAGVSPTSMTRLLHALDYESYDLFQSAHRSWLTHERTGAFSGRADKLISGAKAPGAEDALLDAMAEAERANIAAGLAPERREALKQAASLVLAAPSVTIAGIRSCFPVAFGLRYALSLFMSDVRLMMGAGAALMDDLHHLGEGDVLVAITVTPCSRETVEAARFARSQKARVVAITDGNLTPLARLADVTLVANNDSPAHIASPIGPNAVAQALAMLVLARAGESALEAMKGREARLAAASAYVTDEDTQ